MNTNKGDKPQKPAATGQKPSTPNKTRAIVPNQPVNPFNKEVKSPDRQARTEEEIQSEQDRKQASTERD